MDILIMWFIIYQLFRFVSGSRTIQIITGLVALLCVQWLVDYFGLVAVSKTMESLFSIIPFVIIVLFQDEIRRVLASIGSYPFVRSTSRTTDLDNIFQAAVNLSKTGTGALIVFEGEQGLREFIDGGTRIDAVVSAELLVDLFIPKSILHDGAVIISKSRIASAACLLPLSQDINLPKQYGTRHRAAIGISEVSDCIALVVSEETSKISFTKGGSLVQVKERNLSKLYETYHELVMTETRDKLDPLRYVTKFKKLYKPFVKLKNQTPPPTAGEKARESRELPQ